MRQIAARTSQHQRRSGRPKSLAQLAYRRGDVPIRSANPPTVVADAIHQLGARRQINRGESLRDELPFAEDRANELDGQSARMSCAARADAHIPSMFGKTPSALSNSRFEFRKASALFCAAEIGIKQPRDFQQLRALVALFQLEATQGQMIAGVQPGAIALGLQ